jgi:hypothetical protein
MRRCRPFPAVLLLAPMLAAQRRNSTAISLHGLPIYEQCAVLAASANALGIQMSNQGVQVVGERLY